MVALKILWVFLGCLGSYLLGSIPFSVLVGLLTTGKDLREFNIGNPGGFNAILTYGPVLGLTIMFLDFLKGTVSIALLDQLFQLSFFVAEDGSNVWRTLVCILGPAFCALGHNHPVWLKFRGGRGLGVLLGTFVYVNPLIFVLFIIVYGGILIELLNFPPRVAMATNGLLFVPVGLFLPVSPPWNTIISDWTIGATNFVHLTQGFILLAVWLAWLPRLAPSILNVLRGKKEWSFSATEGQDLTEELETVQDFDESFQPEAEE